MKHSLQGIAILLCSILFAITFHNVGWVNIGDIDLQWQHLFMLTGLAGVVLTFLPSKE